MYKLVEPKIVKPYKIFCSDTLNQLKNILRNDYDIECKFRVIGSGSKDIVTQNGNEPFDLDYNLYITRFPHNFDPNTSDKMKWLKDTIRNELNELLGDAGYDIPSSYLFAVAKYARLILGGEEYNAYMSVYP